MCKAIFHSASAVGDRVTGCYPYGFHTRVRARDVIWGIGVTACHLSPAEWLTQLTSHARAREGTRSIL